jgi:nitrogen regulatory protein PII-like uncharacterized protein
MLKSELELKNSHLQKVVNKYKNEAKEEFHKRIQGEEDMKKAISAFNDSADRNAELLNTNKRLMKIIKRLSESLTLTYNEIK